jgi:hypothetical protein
MHLHTRVLFGAAATVLAAGNGLGAIPAWASNAPAGNNGTVKIDEYTVDSGPDNDPHVACDFSISFYGYDGGSPQTATVQVSPVAPTGGSGSYHTSTSWDIGTRTGGDQLDQTIQVTMSDLSGALAGVQPQPQQGYHLRLEVEVTGSRGSDDKYKVFWLSPCGGTAPGGGTGGGTTGGSGGGTTGSGGGTTGSGGGTTTGSGGGTTGTGGGTTGSGGGTTGTGGGTTGTGGGTTGTGGGTTGSTGGTTGTGGGPSGVPTSGGSTKSGGASGSGSGTTATGPGATTAGASGGHPAGTVAAGSSVPTAAGGASLESAVQDALGGSATVTTGSASSALESPGAATPGAGSLAFTGADVGGPLGLAGGLIGAGFLLVRRSRRTVSG